MAACVKLAAIFLLISSLSDAQVVRLIAFGVEEFVLVVEVEVAGEEGDEA